MRLRLTLADPRRATTVDVEVDAPAGTRLADVASELAAALGSPGRAVHPPEDARWFVGDRALGDDAVLGRPPLLHGAVLSSNQPAGTSEPVGLLALAVVAGPAAGTVLPLLPGQRTLGRSAACALAVPDPDCSRLHAVLDVSHTGVRVGDLGSTNGTALDGVQVPQEGAQLVPGRLLRAGASLLEVVPPGAGAAPASSSPDGAGHLLVNRPPRVRPPHDPVSVRFPAPPAPRQPARFPLLTTAVPVLLGLVLALLVDPRFALFVLLSPVMLLGGWAGERWGGRRTRREELRRYEAERARARDRLEQALSDELSDLRDRHPDLARLLLAAEAPSVLVWERRRADPDFLVLRLGTGAVPARTRRIGPPVSDGESEEDEPLVDAPVVVDLTRVGHLGLSGPSEVTGRLAAALVGQVAVLHGPRDVGLSVLVAGEEGSGERAASHAAEQGRLGADRPGWGWTRWLPHTPSCAGPPTADDVLDGLVTLLDSRERPPGQRGWSGPRAVLVLDGARTLRQDPRVARILADGPAVGLHCLCVDRSPGDLPAECGAVADLAERGELLLSTADALPTRARADLAPPGWAVRLARALAPLEDATPADEGASLPTSVRLLDLLDVEPDPGDLCRRWETAQRAGGLPAVLGAGLDGPLRVDLAADGPHALVAGTTGAGKSELLRTLVASLAVTHPPEDLQLLLVDYKGGSAFDECVHLPHVTGLVTDLDGHLTARVLASLSAELRRRERVLRAAGAGDLEAWRRLRAVDGGPLLPRLVVVVDELAALVEELPEFVTGLVGVAQRGRSLGVHLVLATQRPAGVVSPEVRANTALRIALRVTDPAESVDVVDVPAAAFLPRTVPGRALLRAATGAAVPLQAASVSGRPPRAEATGPRVRRLDAPAPAPAAAGAETSALPSDLTRIVAAARAAAAARSLAHPAPPWLPPLPEVVPLADLVELAGPSPAAAPEHQPAGGLVPFALADLPAEQRRDVVALRLGGPHLAVTGGPRSGRTSTLRALAVAAAGSHRADDLHLHAVDGSGHGLGPLAVLPHTGTVVGRDDPARLDRLVRRLLEEVSRRQAWLAGRGLSALTDHAAPQDAGTRDRDEDRPTWILLLVDGWEGVAEALDGVDHGRGLDDLLRLLREGPAVGLTAAVAGDRQVVMGRIGSLLPQRLVLRTTDVADAALAGLAPRDLPDRMPPGRGVLVEGAVEVQVGLPAADPSGPAQVAALADLAQRCRPAAAHRPLRLLPLPGRADRRSLPGPRQLVVPLGLGGDEAEPVGVDLAEHPVLLVAGPPGSGRTTALATLGLGAAQCGEVLALTGPRSALAQALAPAAPRIVPPGDPELLRQELARLPDLDRPLVLLVDDVERLEGDPVEPLLVDLLEQVERAASGGRVAVVAAGGADALATAFRGVAPTLRRARAGLLLRPGGGLDADLLGTRVPRLDAAPPGRGVLVLGGRATVLQVAAP